MFNEDRVPWWGVKTSGDAGVMAAQQYECTHCPRTVHLKMVNFMSTYILPQFLKIVTGCGERHKRISLENEETAQEWMGRQCGEEVTRTQPAARRRESGRRLSLPAEGRGCAPGGSPPRGK